MSEFHHIYIGQNRYFATESEAYEFLGREIEAVFHGFGRNSVAEVLIRVPPMVHRAEIPFDDSFVARARFSVEKVG